MTTFLALLRGINVGGNRKVPMDALRAVATERGLGDVRTYIQSGNLVFTGKGTPRSLEAKLEEAILARFGFPVDVLVRTATEWRAHAEGNPFVALSAAEANRVMLLLEVAPEPGRSAVAPRARGPRRAGEGRRGRALGLLPGGGGEDEAHADARRPPGRLDGHRAELEDGGGAPHDGGGLA